MNTSATIFFLTVKDGGLWVEYRGTHGGNVLKLLTKDCSEHDAKRANDFFDSKMKEAGRDISVMTSSSIDFSDEYGMPQADLDKFLEAINVG